MNRPSLILRYVKLTTSEPLDQDAMRAWFTAVKSMAPSGVISSIQTTDDTGSLRSASLVHREREDKEHDYIVPLTRDLTDKEVEPIIAAFAAAHDEVDFDVEVSSAEADKMTAGTSLSVDDDKFGALCNAWAKRQHDSWMHERTEAGWSYGTSISTKNKTHPLIRPWQDLPEQFRKVDHQQPQSLLDLLNDQGYAVISKSELEGILSLLRKK